MTTSQINVFDRIDELEARLGTIQLELLEILAKSGQEHQEIDARYAPELNPRYRQAQDIFDELRRLATAHKSEMLVGDKKSSKRNTGTLGWRITPRLVLHVPEAELIERLRGLGQVTYRRFVRRTVKRELNRDALLSLSNKDLVATLEGIEVSREDDFYAIPSGAFRMSSAKPYWPTLEGMSGQMALTTVMDSADA